jgi:RimJ/RimL family protein N-acetyltransferase
MGLQTSKSPTAAVRKPRRLPRGGGHATVYAQNDGSRRVLEKVGFTEEGLLRQEGFVGGEHVDVVRCGLLAEELE